MLTLKMRNRNRKKKERKAARWRESGGSRWETGTRSKGD